MKKINFDEVKHFISKQGPNTKIYIGADSERVTKGNDEHFAEFYLVVVVHIDGRHGCKIFGEVQVERDYDNKISKPSTRLMTEVYKVAELYLKLADVLEDREVEVHLDINPDEKYNSSIVVQQAIGYIKGVCNVEPRVKPQAFAASYAADRLKSLNLSSVAA
jgi:predicted RNase H-related nuclease YkuK (DUF458 family)